MTRRSCAIYATGIVSAHLLIVGIALVVAQVFQTMIHERLKKVSGRLDAPVSVVSRVIFASTFLSHFGVLTLVCGCIPSVQHPGDSRPHCRLVFNSTCVQMFFILHPFT